ncbi:MAG: hypothetical protein PHT40_00715 [Patescibacteria group bacterium]|nr:hypothetical protein [Patescibacteria group bacterium]
MEKNFENDKNPEQTTYVVSDKLREINMKNPKGIEIVHSDGKREILDNSIKTLKMKDENGNVISIMN